MSTMFRFYIAALLLCANFAMSQTVQVFDNPVDVSDELTGQTDFDNDSNRNLTIAWNAPANGATDWHVYVRQNFGGPKYLGHTGSGSAARLHWFAGANGIHRDYRNGPQYGSVYSFRVIRIDGSFGTDDVFDQAGMTGFNIDGGEDVDFTSPYLPQAEPRHLLFLDDLPTLGVHGLSDEDDPRQREIMLIWNFGRPVPIFNYHIQISINGSPFEYLGQTMGDISYFRWNPEGSFITAPKFQDGPQDGNVYQFRVIQYPFEGPRDILKSRTLSYTVVDRISTPTPTPTMTPTPQPTATPTSTPTQIPGFNDESRVVKISGLPAGAKPLKLIRIPAGEFLQGSPVSEQDREANEGPQHPTTITSAFYIGQFEVTQAQYEAVIGSNPSIAGGINHPVFLVTWYDAAGFCNALSRAEKRTPAYDETNWSFDPSANGYRLPSESEWEYAARAGTETRFYWGDDPNHTAIGGYAWYNLNAMELAMQAGVKVPNSYGLFDMSGNVWEWCTDTFADYSAAEQTDPIVTTGEDRVVRGGSWYSGVKFLRSATRQGLSPGFKSGTVGFRVVLD